MFRIIIPKIVVKELSNINRKDQQLIYKKLKDLEAGNFANN